MPTSLAPTAAGGLAGLPVGQYAGDLLNYLIEQLFAVDLPSNVESDIVGLMTVALILAGGRLGYGYSGT